jgi:hypothetical protein
MASMAVRIRFISTCWIWILSMTASDTSAAMRMSSLKPWPAPARASPHAARPNLAGFVFLLGYRFSVFDSGDSPVSRPTLVEITDSREVGFTRQANDRAARGTFDSVKDFRSPAFGPWQFSACQRGQTNLARRNIKEWT